MLNAQRFLAIFLVVLLTQACDNPPGEISSISSINWQKRRASNFEVDSMQKGTSYLSVYSQIYSETEHRKHNLTATVSMRNTNTSDTIYIDEAVYYDTHGKSIRDYFHETIFIAPMETVEIVIDEIDLEGGTGGNFLFEWQILPNSREPLFEAVMISTSGQQGLSFTTVGQRID